MIVGLPLIVLYEVEVGAQCDIILAALAVVVSTA